MRNLQLLETRQVADQESLGDCQKFTVDPDTGTVYAASGKYIYGIDVTLREVCSTVCLTDEDFLPGDGSGRIVGVQYLTDQQGVCVAAENGNLLFWTVHTGQIECVGSVESGFTAWSWSPDLELLVLATGNNTLLLITREFDPITEVPFHPEASGEASFVSVGWGKKETQFHGSEGKEAARIKAEAVKPVSQWDDRCPRISWRGDGQFFVVSHISSNTGARQLNVWTRECALHCTCEVIDGLEQAAAWKPSGSLIVSTQMRPNKHDVVFFEKNGLRHGEFTLPFPVNKVEVRELLWNLESTVLAVVCQDLPEGQATREQHKPCSYVLLWTVNNYHWYLKQSLEFPEDQRVIEAQWDPEHGYKLHVVCEGGKYLQYTWAWATCCSTGMSSDDLASVAVIDGKQLLVTPMSSMIIPPPMSAYQLEFQSTVSHVTFGCTERSNDIAVMLADQQIAIYSFKGKDNSDATVRVTGAGGNGFQVQCRTPCLQRMYPSLKSCDNLGFKDKYFPLNLMHMTWLTSDSFLLCGESSKGDHSVLYRLAMKDDTLELQCSVDVESYIHGITVSVDSPSVAVQLTDGTVLRYCIESDSLMPWEKQTGEELKFPYTCSRMSVCQLGGQEVVIGLTERFRLYVDDVEIASNCTSFAIHEEFLLLTTLSHTCRCISRHTKIQDLPMLSDGKAHPFDESIRRVERGSRIVTVVPQDTKLVLQMPRGNLETIHPRALVLSAVRKSLDRLKYREAFLSMRKHRINMNLIYDHNPQMFCDNVDTFVSQVESPNYLNLFLTDLGEDDVTQTMYTAAYNRTVVSSDDSSSKVDTVCNCVRDAVVKADQDKYLLTIITSYVKKSEAELEAALRMVKSLRDKKRDTCVITAEEALNYLLFLVDVNQLYDIALGMYDFDVVLMVATKSQKDPKEYIPFLNNLRRMEENYCKFTIDKHLRRFKKALEHIAKCGPDKFQECLHHIEEHKLYVDGLRIFPSSSSQFKQVATSYGNYLKEKNRSDEAGVMYVKADEWELALEAFTTCQNWRQVFCMTARLGYSSDKEMEIAKQCARQLQSSNKHLDAGLVYEQYARDVEEAVVCLIEGRLWEEALRMMYRHKRTDFIETNLKSALTECHEQYSEMLEENSSQLDRYSRRLQTVRDKKEQMKLDLMDGEGPMNTMDSDLYSDTSSAMGESVQSQVTFDSQRSTVISRGTGRTSRGKRKGDQKRWSLKEGSQYEDCALIDALAKLIVSTDNMKEDINLLMKSLVQFNYDNKAASLQEQFDALLQRMEKSLSQIWLDESSSAQSIPSLGPNMTANAIAQAMQQGGVASTGEKKDPVLVVPPKLRKDVRWRLHMVQSSGE